MGDLDTYTLAVVGSRSYSDERQVKNYFNLLKEETEKKFHIVTGGASGVDSWAEDAAKALGIPVTLVLPSDKTYDAYPVQMRPLKRNEDVVKMCDGLVAFWDMAVHLPSKNSDKSMTDSGTVHVIKIALMARKLIKVITPFGWILRPQEDMEPPF